MNAALFILILFLFLAHKARKLGALELYALLCTYVISFILALYINTYNHNIMFIPTLYLAFFLIPMFFCFLPLRKNNLTKIVYGKKLFWRFSLFFGYVGVVATIYFSFFTFKIFLTQDISSLRISGTSIGTLSLIPTNLLSTILAHFACLFYVSLLLMFLSLRDQWGKYYSSLFFISSLSYSALTLAYAGRDGIVYWIMNFSLLYFLFKKDLPSSSVNFIKKMIVLGGTLLGGVVLFISYQRFIVFGYSDSLFYSIFNYGGQALGNFSDAFRFEGYEKGQLFSGVSKLLGISSEKDSSETLWILNQHGVGEEYNVFGYYVKTFIWVYGKIGGFLVGMLFAGICWICSLRFVQNKSFYFAIIILTLFQIPFQGVFYYRQGVGNQDLPYLFIIFICLILYFFSQKRLIFK